MAVTDWEPATEAETAMRDALHANNQELYFRILAGTELLLPVSAQALAGEAPMGWGTWTTGGRTHVLAFTSTAALRACLGATAGPSRRAPYADLAATWPNHEWWLAVNPGLPIEGYLPAWFVSQLSRGDVRLPGRTMGARARLERVESVARGQAEPTGPAPATGARDPAPDARSQPRPVAPPTSTPAIGAGPDASAARPGAAGPAPARVPHPARPSAAPYRPEPDRPRPSGTDPVVPAAASYPEVPAAASYPDVVPVARGTRPGGEPRPPADPANGRPAATPPSDPDGSPRPPVAPWMTSPRRRLLGEGLGARLAGDGGPPNGRTSFFEPAAERGASTRASRDPLRTGERAAPPPRPGLGGQAFPRRRPATERPGEEPTRAFQFDRPDGQVPPPAPADRRPDPLAEEPTRAFRVPAPDAEATQALPRRHPTPAAPPAEEQTQRLPDPSARPTPPPVEELPVSIAEPVSGPPAPRRGFSPIVIEGTVIESRDLPVTPAPDRIPPATAGLDNSRSMNGSAGGGQFAAAGAAATAFPRPAFPSPSADDPTEPISPAPGQRTEPVFPAAEQRTSPLFAAPEQRTETAFPPPEQRTEPVFPAAEQPTRPVFPAPEQRTEPIAPVPGGGSAAQAAPDDEEPTEPLAPVSDDRAQSLFAVPTAPVSPAFGGRPEGASSATAPVSPASRGRPEAAVPSPAAPVSPAFEGPPERTLSAEAAPAGPTPAGPSVAEHTPPGETAGGAGRVTPAQAAEAFQPANSVEEDLLDAAGSGSTDTFLSTLLLARVLLPVAPESAPGSRPGEPGFVWRTEELDGETYVVVHTSPERLADHCPEPVETVEVRFVQLIRRWPDEVWSFAVNPGSPIGAKLPGEQIVGLANWAAEVGLGDETEIEPAAVAVEEPADRPRYAPQVADPTRPVSMQKAVAPSQLAYYLERGYDRVSGFVHRANELAHLNTPAQLHDALGLGYPDSPFARDADRIYVLRWPAYRPSLYRIPYGGQSEAAMRAMEGWVIERPPFRGNGFAPGDSTEVVAEFKVDSARLPHGAQLWRIGADGTERVIALLDTDALLWRQVGEP
ncbi:SseB protein N-terminal domain-containing protein [Micromonospora purpureochromogenes]|uniref:SseB protein N-terminal domain-containing protein n=1 Tax=Micromonospora purpureochromogenes TaxID=47872 RepID=A0A1C4U440_9ACTN|nr:SseB protein N-terminal domain-containing protein [Micromonospora purpureochromogenes]